MLNNEEYAHTHTHKYVCIHTYNKYSKKHCLISVLANNTLILSSGISIFDFIYISVLFLLNFVKLCWIGKSTAKLKFDHHLSKFIVKHERLKRDEKLKVNKLITILVLFFMVCMYLNLCLQDFLQ